MTHFEEALLFLNVAFMGAKVSKVEVQRGLKGGSLERTLATCVNCESHVEYFVSHQKNLKYLRIHNIKYHNYCYELESTCTVRVSGFCLLVSVLHCTCFQFSESGHTVCQEEGCERGHHLQAADQ